MRFRRTVLATVLGLSALAAVAAHANQQTINVGSAANDGTGDTARSAFQKVNANFAELYATVASLLSTSAQKAANLSDLANAATARTNLGLGSAATQATSAFVAASVVSSYGANLTGAADAAAARTVLGLGTAATQASSAFAAASHTHAASDITSGVFATARLGTGTASSTTCLLGNSTWGACGSGGATAYGSVVTLTDGATVTPDASLLTTPTMAFSWAPPSSGGRTLNAPINMMTGAYTQRVRIFALPAGTGTFTPTLGTGISGSVSIPRGSVSEITLTTSNGGTSWTAEGGGVDLPANTFLAADGTATLKPMALRQQVAFCFSYAPSSGETWGAPMPFAGTVAGVRAFAAGTGTPTITGTVSINGTAVTGLATQTYGAQAGNVPLVTATAANSFAAGDQVAFANTSAPGGTVTRGCVSIEVVQES